MIDIDGANLIAAALGGDSESFVLLVTGYASRIRGYVASRLNGNEDVDDVTQDTWTAVWKQLALYDERRGPVDGWLFGIADNKAADCRRARARDAARCAKAQRSRLPEADPAIADWEVHEEFARMLEKVPPAQRTALTLRFERDLSLDVTARAMHRSSQAVEMLQQRGLRSLRTRMSVQREINR